MIEVSAAVSPALALPGAVLSAAPAVPSGESAQIVDFSAVLSGVALAIAPEAGDSTPIDMPPPAAAAQPTPTGKSGLAGNRAGNQTGKLLPPGKLPATRKLAADLDPTVDEQSDDTAEPEPAAKTRGEVEPAAPAGAPVQTTAEALLSQEQRTTPTLPAASEPARISARPVQTAQVATPALPIAGAHVAAPAQPTPAPVLSLEAAVVVPLSLTAPEIALTMRTDTAPQPVIADPMPLAAQGSESTADPMVTQRAAATLVAAQMSVALQAPRTSVAAIASAPVALQPAAEASVDAERRSTHAIAQPMADPIAPAVRADIAAAPAELRPTPAAPVTTAAQPAAPQTHDLATLVDRITEARAAAAPHGVRAALVHEDFGSVSLNFRPEDSHIHVTLGSADPGFAPAVHAAAAATLTGNDGDRRENGETQQHTQQQGSASDAGASNNSASPQQHPPRERLASGERPARENAQGRRQAGTADTPSDPASPRRSGIYA